MTQHQSGRTVSEERLANNKLPIDMFLFCFKTARVKLEIYTVKSCERRYLFHETVLVGVGLMCPNFEKNEKNAIFRFWRRKKRKITVILLRYR